MHSLDEIDGNVDFGGPGPAVKAKGPNNKLKRKLSPDEGGGSRSIARRLDFTK